MRLRLNEYKLSASRTAAIKILADYKIHLTSIDCSEFQDPRSFRPA